MLLKKGRKLSHLELFSDLNAAPKSYGDGDVG
jgi:hypothetical protein